MLRWGLGNVGFGIRSSGRRYIGIGYDQMFGYIIDAKQSVLSFNDERISLMWEGQFGCFKVVAMDKNNSPPRSKLIASDLEKIDTMHE